MDMAFFRPKAIWGLNGTELPGAVYLAAVLACQAQRRLPAFSIYGKDVQNAEETIIPDDVAQKILILSSQIGLALNFLRGKTYLALGSVSRGIAVSIVDPNFFEDYLDMRVHWVDMTELRRRIDKKIYDENELALALNWAEKNFKFGLDPNPLSLRLSKTACQQVLKESLLMAIIIRAMMEGNSILAEKG